jgi:dienelactone hydrolase
MQELWRERLHSRVTDGLGGGRRAVGSRGPLPLALLTLSLLLSPTPSRAAPCQEPSAAPGTVTDQALGRREAYAWHAPFLEDDGICLRSRQSGAELRAFLLAPVDIEDRQDHSLPVVVIGPASGGSARAMNYLWSARELAGQGYLALAVDPQGVGRSAVAGDEPENCDERGCPGVPFQKASNFMDGLVSGTDYLFTREHPWLSKADLSRIGLAGHSLSARAASYLGGIDQRISAVVAWDNMSSTLSGDAGVSSGGGDCGALIGGEPPGPPLIAPPRIPTLGQASDAPGGCTGDRDPEVKKTGYEHWRAAGTPTMQIVFAGAAHGNWTQTSSSVSEQLQLFQYYTRAWFDLYLKHDDTARARLLSPEVLGRGPEQIYSPQFRSAAFMPERELDCADLLDATCPLPLPPRLLGLPERLEMLEDQSLIHAFRVDDPDTPDELLRTSVSSNRSQLFPPGSLQIEGSGSDRLLRIAPAPDRFGEALIEVELRDGIYSTRTNVLVTVLPVNDPPRILSEPPLVARLGLLYRYQLAVVDPDDPVEALRFSLLESPLTMTISETGLIQWMPTAPQGAANSVPVKVSVADSGADGAAPAEQHFELRIETLPPTPSPGPREPASPTISPTPVDQAPPAPKPADGDPAILRQTATEGGGPFEWQHTVLCLLIAAARWRRRTSGDSPATALRAPVRAVTARARRRTGSPTAG